MFLADDVRRSLRDHRARRLLFCADLCSPVRARSDAATSSMSADRTTVAARGDAEVTRVAALLPLPRRVCAAAMPDVA